MADHKFDSETRILRAIGTKGRSGAFRGVILRELGGVLASELKSRMHDDVAVKNLLGTRFSIDLLEKARISALLRATFEVTGAATGYLHMLLRMKDAVGIFARLSRTEATDQLPPAGLEEWKGIMTQVGKSAARVLTLTLKKEVQFTLQNLTVADLPSLAEIVTEETMILAQGDFVWRAGPESFVLWVVPYTVARQLTELVEKNADEDIAGFLGESRQVAGEADRRNILVVEDTAAVRNIMKLFLSQAGYTVLEAGSAEQARKILQGIEVHLILLDVMMPGTDGLAFLKELKRAEKLAAIPVVMCTAQSERQIVVDAIRSGAADYIVKPFNKETLLKKVEHVLTTK